MVPEGTTDQRIYLIYDLSSVTEPGDINSASAELQMTVGYLQSTDDAETLTLFQASSLTFADLGDGAVYGSRVISRTDFNTDVSIALTDDAIAALNAAKGVGQVIIGGAITTQDPLSPDQSLLLEPKNLVLHFTQPPQITDVFGPGGTVNTGDIVSFECLATDPDSDALTFTWSFGDGASGEGYSVSHIYSTAGTYTVTVTVKDDSNNSVSQSISVTVAEPNRPPVISNVTGPTEPVDTGAATGFVCTATDPDGDSMTFSWNFGDGSTAEGSSVSHSFATAGTYTVFVTVADGQSGSTSQSYAVTVEDPNNPPEITSVTGPTDPIQKDAAAGFDCVATDPDDDTLTFNWDFGDGLTGEGSSVSHSYSAAGTYIVVVSVSDGYGGIASDEIEVTVVDDNNAPVITSAGADPAVACVKDKVYFKAAATDEDGDTLTYTWDFGDGTSATGTSAEHEYTTKGTYTVTLTVIDGKGGSATQTISVKINELTITAAKSTLCAGESMGLTVSGGEAPYTWSSSAESVAVVQYEGTGETATLKARTKKGGRVKVTATDSHGCKATLDVTVVYIRIHYGSVKPYQLVQDKKGSITYILALITPEDLKIKWKHEGDGADFVKRELKEESSGSSTLRVFLDVKRAWKDDSSITVTAYEPDSGCESKTDVLLKKFRRGGITAPNSDPVYVKLPYNGDKIGFTRSRPGIATASTLSILDGKEKDLRIDVVTLYYQDKNDVGRALEWTMDPKIKFFGDLSTSGRHVGTIKESTIYALAAAGALVDGKDVKLTGNRAMIAYNYTDSDHVTVNIGAGMQSTFVITNNLFAVNLSDKSVIDGTDELKHTGDNHWPGSGITENNTVTVGVGVMTSQKGKLAEWWLESFGLIGWTFETGRFPRIFFTPEI